jgi:ribosomal protein S12 methylthiotransferase accessory factor
LLQFPTTAPRALQTALPAADEALKTDFGRAPKHFLINTLKGSKMEIMVDFPGGYRVDAHFRSFTVQTDQPIKNGGDNTAPAPFDMFLVSLATCAGYYVSEFCKTRKIDTKGIRVIQKTERDAKTKMVSKILLEIQLPDGFPERYVSAVMRAVDSCSVKKHLEKPPEFEIYTSISDSKTKL